MTQTDSSKVRFVAFYDDPEYEDHMLSVYYEANKPTPVKFLCDLETYERREAELVGFGSTGGWVTIEEAEDMVADIYESEIEGGDE